MDRVKVRILAAVVLGSAVSGLSQPAETKIEARHVIGLENVKRNHPVTLSIVDGGLQLQTGKTTAKVSIVSIASIDDIFIGTETTQGGGKAGTVAKTAAMAAPYDSGAVLSILLRTNVDVLTVSYRDSGGGLHYVILAMAKGQGAQQRAQYITAGAHVLPPAGQELKESMPVAPIVQTPRTQKFSASAIQIEPVANGDVRIPAEFRAAVYEFLVTRVRESGVFRQVFRSGDRAAAAVPDLVTLHTTVQKFNQGSQMKRELTTVLGATKLNVEASVTNREGRVLLDRRVNGKVRFFGENLGVANDIGKRIAKVLKQE